MIDKNRLAFIADQKNTYAADAMLFTKALDMAQELIELRTLVANKWEREVEGWLYCGYCDGYSCDTPHSTDCPVLKYKEYVE